MLLPHFFGDGHFQREVCSSYSLYVPQLVINIRSVV